VEFETAYLRKQCGAHITDMIDSVLALQRVTSSVLVCSKRKFF